MLACALCGAAALTPSKGLGCSLPNGGGVNVVGSRHVRLRLASLEPRQTPVRISLRGRPNLTPRSLARFLPSPVPAVTTPGKSGNETP